MDWVPGVKLTQLEPQEIRELVAVGQTAFLTQLLDVGFIHGDPHPGTSHASRLGGGVVYGAATAWAQGHTPHECTVLARAQATCSR